LKTIFSILIILTTGKQILSSGHSSIKKKYSFYPSSKWFTPYKLSQFVWRDERGFDPILNYCHCSFMPGNIPIYSWCQSWVSI